MMRTHINRASRTTATTLYLLGLLLLLAQLTGCEMTDPGNSNATEFVGLDVSEVHVPEGFEFALRTDCTLLVNVQMADGSPYPHVRLDIQRNDGQHLTTGFTGIDGSALLAFILPDNHSEIIVSAPAIGIINPERRVQLSGNLNTITIR